MNADHIIWGSCLFLLGINMKIWYDDQPLIGSSSILYLPYTIPHSNPPLIITFPPWNDLGTARRRSHGSHRPVASLRLRWIPEAFHVAQGHIPIFPSCWSKKAMKIPWKSLGFLWSITNSKPAISMTGLSLGWSRAVLAQIEDPSWCFWVVQHRIKRWCSMKNGDLPSGND